MKLEDIIWDVRHILMALSENTTVLDGDIIEKLNSYRMAYINKFWQKNHYVLEDWFQPLGSLIVSDWNALIQKVEVPISGITYTVITGTVSVEETEETHVTTVYTPGQSFLYQPDLNPELGGGFFVYTFNGTVGVYVIGGQCNAPRTIQLANDIQYRIYKDVLGSVMYPIGYRQLLMMIEFADERNSKFDFYSFKENKFFTYPKNNITGSAIFEEPTEIRSRTMEVVTEIENMTLINGLRYKVLTGSIMYPIGETVYNAGEYFTAGATNEWDPGSESSVGKVDSIPIPDIGHGDIYPIDVEGARECILEMLTKDYRIRMNSISDTVQDDQDQFKVLTSRT